MVARLVAPLFLNLPRAGVSMLILLDMLKIRASASVLQILIMRAFAGTKLPFNTVVPLFIAGMI